MRKLCLKRKSATALGVCFGQTGGDRKAQAAGLDRLPPGILGLTDGVLRPPRYDLSQGRLLAFAKIRDKGGKNGTYTHKPYCFYHAQKKARQPTWVMRAGEREF